MTQQQLTTSGAQWLLQEGKCLKVFELASESGKEEPYSLLLGLGSFGRTILLALYHSRLGFLQGPQNQFNGNTGPTLGRYRFLAAPAGALTNVDVPENWGLLEISETLEATCLINPYQSEGGSFWRNGFEDTKVYDLLAQDEKLFTACRRLTYTAMVWH
ncbi:MAG: hypothetical protein ACO1OQ_13160 [Rufibacter sp.]